MSHIILHHEGVFNVFCTISDMPIFLHGIKKDDLIVWKFITYGSRGTWDDLDMEIETAENKGTSSLFYKSLEDTIRINYAGPNHKSLDLEAFINKFMVIPENYEPYDLDLPLRHYIDEFAKSKPSTI